MKKTTHMVKIVSILGILMGLLSCSTTQTKLNLLDTDQDFNAGWKFTLDEENDFSATDVDDNDWRMVDLPHDWSVEFEFDSAQGEGCTAYLLGGIGWYRKHFTLDIDSTEEAHILFDGIYNHSEVWINGQKLGYRPYGYVPFHYNLTPHLKDGDNVIAVKVDHSRYADSRWYSGSGIYRNVKLIKANKLQIPIWGTFITTPEVSETEASISLDVDVANNYNSEKSFVLETRIVNPQGMVVSTISSEATVLAGGEKATYTQTGSVSNPDLWGIENPALYKAITTVTVEGNVVDDHVTTFGIRSFEFDPEKGFFLNGENMKIKGVNLHHDGGLVGAAVPKGVWKRRLQILRDGGCNAIRISHNPSSDELLDLCDEMGFLVQDEFFDEWDYPKDKRLNMVEQHDDYITRGSAEYFQEWAEADLKATMLAHRNHPSIIQWSIGNEIEWTYPRNRLATGFFDNMDWSGNYFWSQPPYSREKIKEVYNSSPAKEYNIETTAHKLAEWTRELDTTRPVIANCILPSASFETGYADALDIVGFSYRRVMYDYARKNFPEKTVMGTENLPQWHEWKAIEERDFVSGTYLWTGIDYMGEANGRWPHRSVASGLIDQAGFAKPPYHMYKTLWTDEDVMYVYSQTAAQSLYTVNEEGNVVEKTPGQWETLTWEWPLRNDHWNYSDGESIIVEVISSCAEVELFLNEESLGTKQLSEFPDRIYKWEVPFAAGTITAKGVSNGNTIESSITTAGDPVAVEVEVDKTTLTADGYDVAHIITQLVDADGNPVVNQEKEITFKVEGAVKSLGVDNGSPRNVQKFQSDALVTASGKAMIIVQALREHGDATITIGGDGIEETSVSLHIH